MDENIPHKVCFKCGRDLPLTEYYKHAQMADGHLNKCKECTKKDVHNKYKENVQDPSYVEKERARGRDKYRRLYGNFNPELFAARPKVRNFKRYQSNLAKNSRKRLQRRKKWLNLPPSTAVHHWSYKHPHEVFIISRYTHQQIHHLTRYVAESNCFVDLQTGELLDTLDKYKSWMAKHWFFYGFKNIEEPMYGAIGCNLKPPEQTNKLT